MEVAVVGAGIIGVTTALAVKEAFPQIDVTIFADVFTPGTTGDGSAGLWGPYILKDTSEEDILRWSGRTHEWLQTFWTSKFASEAGVCLIPVTRLTSSVKKYPEPKWASNVYGIQELTSEQLRELNEEHKARYTGGWQFLTFTCEPAKMLPWLLKKFKSLGGKVVKRKVEHLDELFLEGYRIVINCSGLGAQKLANDSSVVPVRGQIIKVDAPWMFHTYIVDDDDGNYIIPNIDFVILGGTHQEGDYDTKVRETDSRFIYEGCCRMERSLRKSKVLTQWVGLRPGRQQVRLEVENPRIVNGLKCVIVHNYGHGGSGVTLSWGCALDVVEIVRKIQNNVFNSKL
ncbi:D-aspartate oxidase [Orussus abietinus]|uniref:D-aspartate oxidase n=1 Tax=Orussus abietinus TaxID=222816 RepID=UPI0006268C53|nr:D-aspartate oxidase [Orussus abietinus]